MNSANPPLTIREAGAGDAQAIAQLHAESWLRTYAGSMRKEYLEKEAPEERRRLWKERFQNPDPDQLILIAEVAEEMVGFICAYLDGRDGRSQWGCFVDNLHVRITHKSQGIGRSLMQAMAERSSRYRPGVGLYLSVTMANEAARGFYRRIGGEIAEEGVWASPDGSAVPILWIVWKETDGLIPG